jgi:hypothetical protein
MPAPARAAAAAATPKRRTTVQSACRPIRTSLKPLLARCTTAVAAMATGTGKNNAKTGISTVPRPNPENRVTPDMTNATADTTTYSMGRSRRRSIRRFDVGPRPHDTR